MTLLVLFILALIWAAVLLPPWLQNRSESRPADSITSFRNQLSVLERRAGSPATVGGVRPVVAGAPVGRASARGGVGRELGREMVNSTRAAARRADTRRRRRDVLFTLMAAAGLSLVLGVVLGGPVLLLHLLVDALLVTYVAMLVRIQRLAAERDMKVRFLPQRTRAPEPALLLRRSAN